MHGKGFEPLRLSPDALKASSLTKLGHPCAGVSSLYHKEMDSRKPIERMNSFLRANRPVDYLEYDRMVRLMLNWIDSHRIRQMDVFLEREGKDYQAFMAFLESELGHTPTFSDEFLAKLVKFARETS